MKAEEYKYLVLGRIGGQHFVIFATNSFKKACILKEQHNNIKRRVASIWYKEPK